MDKKKEKKTHIFSYEVTMLVHVIEDTEELAKKKLDDQGGIMTKRDVKLLNASLLYGEKDN